MKNDTVTEHRDSCAGLGAAIVTDRSGRPLALGAIRSFATGWLPDLSGAEIARIASMGGKARAEKLSAAKLRRIAKLAVAARERNRKENR